MLIGPINRLRGPVDCFPFAGPHSELKNGSNRPQIPGLLPSKPSYFDTGPTNEPLGTLRGQGGSQDNCPGGSGAAYAPVPRSSASSPDVVRPVSIASGRAIELFYIHNRYQSPTLKNAGHGGHANAGLASRPVGNVSGVRNAVFVLAVAFFRHRLCLHRMVTLGRRRGVFRAHDRPKSRSRLKSPPQGLPRSTGKNISFRRVGYPRRRGTASYKHLVHRRGAQHEHDVSYGK
jgi:hypothetical protein